MLNRHSAIYCGPETQLFTHPDLFQHWMKTKKRLLNKPLLISPDLHLIKGVNITGEEQGWTENDLLGLIQDNNEFKTFCDQYFIKSTRHHGKQIWMDKTPSNVLSFEPFLQAWNDGCVLHIVRNPLDIIASLVKRGLPLFLAVSRYLFNTAHALKCMDDARYIVLKYESLVASPEASLGAVLEAIGLQYEADMLKEGNPDMTEVHQMPGWRSSEIEAPNQKSIGRFNSLTEREQSDILMSLRIVQISAEYAGRQGLRHTTAATMNAVLEYQMPESDAQSGSDADSDVMKRLRTEQRRYRQNCLKERRLFYERERPVTLVEK
jgi:hypothetical protein